MYVCMYIYIYIYRYMYVCMYVSYICQYMRIYTVNLQIRQTCASCVCNHAHIHTGMHTWIQKDMLGNIQKQHHTSHTPLWDQSMQGPRPRTNNNAQASQLNHWLVDIMRRQVCMGAGIRLARIPLHSYTHMYVHTDIHMHHV